MSPSRARPSLLRIALLTAATLACFAANSLLCRAALGPRRADPATFTLVRIASGAVVLALVLAARRARPAGGTLGSALALFVYAAAFSLAYVRIGAGVGALLLFAAVQVTMLGWSAVRGVRPRPLQVLGVGVALAGLTWLAAPGASAPDPRGAALMLAAGAAWGVYSLRGRAAGDPLATTAHNFLLSVPLAVALGVAYARGASASPAGVALAVASGALASGGGYSLWYAVVPALGATRAAAVQLAVPVLAGAGATVFLGEQLTARVGVAAVAILAGIAVTLRR
ncbi:DMT family transporter [Anaeromyxobacter oryzae]|nr:DMT family transporter [Anaeromyxobacter oryzae]